ncbi:Mpv17-like protein 2 [Holothuria leucospilota]|uniref:Mpv17-like protein 2 n=1 Tax=Holothuria leucospilota TaxID=206669 RepID=A0A9Q1C7K6_HOLLE|nr:Mpv17-like protein 2 [Holothuria leucospilota]
MNGTQIFSKVAALTRRLYSPKYLAFTNIISGGFFLALSDGIEQCNERYGFLKTHVHVQNHQRHKWDWMRTGRMFAIGVALGPFNHYWYVYLDHFFPGIKKKTVFKKVILDEIIASPFFIVAFFVGAGMLEGKSLKKCMTSLKEKFPACYMVDWMFWPTAQVVNFYLLPTKYRVLYVNCVTVIWDVFLSYMNHVYKTEVSSDLSEEKTG